MRTMVEKIMRKYGTPIVLYRNTEKITIYGFVQHTATTARKYALPEHSILGEIPQGRYVAMIPVDPLVCKDDVLEQDKRRYIIRRVEKIWRGKEPLYCWCLCEQEGEPDGWGN